MASTLTVDNIVGATTAANVKFPAGSVLQVVQGTVGESSGNNASNITLINQSFTPKFSGSKFYVSFMIPNLTGLVNYFQAKAYIGTSSTPTSNTEVIYARTVLQGTGASETQTLNGSDFGSFTCSSTNTHYVSLVCTTGTTTAIGRHSATVKLQCMEIAQ